MTALATALLLIPGFLPGGAGPPPLDTDRALAIATMRGGALGLHSGSIHIPADPEPERILLDAGPAAHYGPGWNWHNLYALHAGWGHAVGPPAGPGEHWCVHVDIDLVGVRLVLVSGGVEIVCVTGDVVAAHDKWSWRQDWGIEVSWELFHALPDKSWVEVYWR